MTAATLADVEAFLTGELASALANIRVSLFWIDNDTALADGALRAAGLRRLETGIARIEARAVELGLALHHASDKPASADDELTLPPDLPEVEDGTGQAAPQCFETEEGAAGVAEPSTLTEAPQAPRESTGDDFATSDKATLPGADPAQPRAGLPPAGLMDLGPIDLDAAPRDEAPAPASVAARSEAAAWADDLAKDLSGSLTPEAVPPLEEPAETLSDAALPDPDSATENPGPAPLGAPGDGNVVALSEALDPAENEPEVSDNDLGASIDALLGAAEAARKRSTDGELQLDLGTLERLLGEVRASIADDPPLPAERA